MPAPKNQQPEKKKGLTNRGRILMRYGIISGGFIVIAMAIAIRLITTTVVKAEAWNRTADSILNQLKVIPPERGNILADNGSILACNLTVYDINFDMRHQKVSELGKKLPWNSIDSLADSLDVYYPRRSDLSQPIDKDSEDSWHFKFKTEFSKKNSERPRALKILKKGSLEDFERIKSFPFFNSFKGSGTRNPVYTDSKIVRIYPFGKMAYRSIGRVNEYNREVHGYSGLEKDLDSMLYGKQGYAKKVMMTSGVDNWVETPAQRGYDVQTTINIDMQDMLEEELTKVCQEENAFWGTALLIEVATGEIKAIANVEKLDDGTYGEALNRAVRGFEPGSVMKPISMMIAFEDGLVKSLNDVVDCSPFQQTSDPHAPTVKNMKQVIEMSSNTGISRVMFRGYSKDPATYHDRLRSIGFFSPMQSGISGEEVPFFPSLAETTPNGTRQTMTARHLSLARQCYGYSCAIPPLYTLAYYNAIANGGVLVKPHLVKKLSSAERGDSIVDPATLSTRICSAETAAKVRECLLQPVWGDHGTARFVRDDRVKIAGKTGTAFPIPDTGGAYDKTKRRFAFAGYFPADNPKYSCMALILCPYIGHGAAVTSGQVVKNMAIKMFSRGMLDNTTSLEASKGSSEPVFAASDKKANRKVTQELGISSNKVMANNSADRKRGVVPDLIGYDPEAAVRILEQLGYNVCLSGAGYVTAQSPLPGQPLKRGGKVNLTLRL
ncbi:MAG: transpeptidase family protein [Muribaculaceae bacterium]|nr:transpeptidase family protein [Muribaculaceae bacterium]